ncbi:MAG: penicillin-binding protein family, nonfunctional [Candidatus Saccharibacteria bacterium]|nr:penicillin-binding protein family, nonfunctional [Candidatus Saccharibacteria bacterium]
MPAPKKLRRVRSAFLKLYMRYARPHITRRRLKVVLLVGIAAFVLLPIATYAYYARDITNRERLMNRNNTGIILNDKNGTPFYSSGIMSSSDDIPLSAIADDLEKAAVASEDKDFYSHHGFSIRGTVRAFVGNTMHHGMTQSGGSTITQQLVKNKLLGSKRNYIRKYQELAMSLAVERRYSKDDILDMYLNSAYFGDGAFGISDAAHTYFGKDPSQLNLAESSMLVGLLPAPTSYSPITGDPNKTKQSQRNVLRKMLATNVITPKQRDQALGTKLTYSNDAQKGGSEYAQHFAGMVIDQIEAKYGEERVRRSGFQVTTTLDLSKQKFAEQVIREQIAITAPKGGKNAGLVSLDPKTGNVLALVGSVDYYNKEFGQVNMATALRQPGSSFKPIYYSDAIDRGLITAATQLNDTPSTFGGTYTPHNYDNRYKGIMPVRNALAESRNIPAVQVMQKEGIANAADAAKRMGIDSVTDPSKYGLSLALGTAEVRLIQSTSAYGAFANQGQHYDPMLYTKISDKYGSEVAKPKQPKPQKVLSPEAAYITASILSDTSARAPTYGTSLNIANKNVALKTGTTNDSRDAWTIGFTPSIVTGVWLGNNENKPMIGLAGGSGAGAIWKRVMENYINSSPREEFEKPTGIVTMQICVGSYNRTEYFKSGTEPKSSCASKNKADTNKSDRKQENQDEKPKTDTGAGSNRPEDAKPKGNGQDSTAPTDPQPTTDPSTPPASGGGGSGGGTTTPPPSTTP